MPALPYPRDYRGSSSPGATYSTPSAGFSPVPRSPCLFFLHPTLFLKARKLIDTHIGTLGSLILLLLLLLVLLVLLLLVLLLLVLLVLVLLLLLLLQSYF